MIDGCNNDNELTDNDFRRKIINYFLGENWYVVDSMSQKQVNYIAYEEITKKYKGIEPRTKLGRAIKAFIKELQ